VCSALKSAGQDINFSQFYELPLLRNPGLAGIFKGDIRLTGAMRNQWSSVTVPYKTESLSAECRFGLSQNSDDYLITGIQITNDVAGDSKLGKTQFLPVIALNKVLSSERDTYLSLGIMGGPVQQRFDPTKLKFDDQFVNGSYSPSNPTQQTFSRTEFTYLDGSVGLIFSSTMGNDISYYIGAGYYHFTKPKVAFNEQNDIVLNRKFIVNGGFAAPTSDLDKLIFYVDYFRQGGNNQAQGGIIYKRTLIEYEDDESVSLSIGSFIRWNDAVIPMIKVDLARFAFGLSYDVNISKLKTASQVRGGFELTFSYRNYLNIRSSSANKTRCPVNPN
jgi:type IX secretion system PorP/SprF family membrane protein